MILELDLGNTRAKWRIVGSRTEVVAQGVANTAEWINGQLPDSWRSGVERVRIASVLSPAIENNVIEIIQSELRVSPQLAQSTALCCGVVNAYKNPEYLGVDRWLALIAAYKLFGGAVMVVDAGTALKIDVVDDFGLHLGGYIIPGAPLMESVLQHSTDRVRYEDGPMFESVALGLDTRACVQNGIAAALAGAIIVAIDQCKVVLGKAPALCIAGGSGALLQQCFDKVGIPNGRLEVDLVLDGLRWALP